MPQFNSTQQQLYPNPAAAQPWPSQRGSAYELESQKPAPAGPRETYPVLVHCEGDLPSRTVSTDATATTATQPYTPLPGSSSGGGAPPPPPGPQQQSYMLQMASWLVPDPRTRYPALFTSAIVLGMAFVFAFMAADHAVWQRTPAGEAVGAAAGLPPMGEQPWGPSALRQWLKFWQIGGATTFNPAYLYAWGGRYSPAIALGQWWRLFASFCLHNSFAHLLSNMLLFVMLAVPLEHTYGPIRIAIIFMASAFGANFLSMTYEDPCSVYVGASGAVFGFIGLALSDLLLNWDSISAPLVRFVVMLAMLGITIAVEYLELPYMPSGRVSHLSHVGGLLGGLFVSFAFLPNLKSRRFKAVRRFVESHWGHRLPAKAPSEHRSCWSRHRVLHGLCLVACVLTVLYLYVMLPLWIWLWKLPRLQCAVVPGLM